MKKEYIDTSKYPLSKKDTKTLGKKCWVKVRIEDGVFYKEDMWFTFDSAVKDYRKYLRLEKINTYWKENPYKKRWELYECEILKNKQIIFK